VETEIQNRRGVRLPATRTRKQICATLTRRTYSQDGRSAEPAAGALLPLDRQAAGFNGGAWLVFGRQCEGCNSTSLAWRRFTTLAEVNAAAGGAPSLE
jgi:hypothetical protein